MFRKRISLRLQCLRVFLLSLLLLGSNIIKADQNFIDNFHRELTYYKQVEQEFYELVGVEEDRKFTFYEELKLANSICKLAESHNKLKKILMDNFDQAKLIFPELTSMSDLEKELQKEIQPFQGMIDKATNTPYECAKQNYE
ncbi:hypothetical protein ABFY41_12370 [Acinetobacter haemolyticus]|uniref:hypothetical protein n=1 Tax=Acinetobacter haemolyticus TaxID=29430 RepID=UPI002A6A9A09|nr:hypothetical protein [Acinetobacter haemolyticus]WPO66129.1 hypothetical protein SDC64_09255 [Acinetobacter haemolyticus]